MSSKQNDAWLEAAIESFYDAIDNKKYDLARDIMCDTKDAGFVGAAGIMKTILEQHECII